MLRNAIGTHVLAYNLKSYRHDVTIACHRGERVHDGSGPSSIVFDPSNYSQNLLTAARALDQINNQIRSLENQAQMLLNQAQASHEPADQRGWPAHIDDQSDQQPDCSGEGHLVRCPEDPAAILNAFIRANIRQPFRPTGWFRTRHPAGTIRYEGLKQTLVTQAAIASALDQDGQTLRTLMANSSAAVGSLQAQQSGNELLGLQIKQSLQAQALACDPGARGHVACGRTAGLVGGRDRSDLPASSAMATPTPAASRRGRHG